MPNKPKRITILGQPVTFDFGGEAPRAELEAHRSFSERCTTSIRELPFCAVSIDPGKSLMEINAPARLE